MLSWHFFQFEYTMNAFAVYPSTVSTTNELPFSDDFANCMLW